MGIKDFLASTKRLMNAATRPRRKETWMMLKVSLIGVVAIGAIGFIIQVLFLIVGLSP
jgi:protein translocase SEC61 complex gamma subunit